MNRRTALQLLGSAATVGLAGCSASSPDDTQSSSTDTSSDTEQTTTMTTTDSLSSLERGWTAHRGNVAQTGSQEQTQEPVDFPLTKDWEVTLNNQISTAPGVLVPDSESTPTGNGPNKKSDHQPTESPLPTDTPVLFLGTEAGTMHAINADTGSEVWEHQYTHLEAIRTNPIVISEAGVYIVDKTASMYSISTTTGKIQNVIKDLQGTTVPSMPSSRTDQDQAPFSTPVVTPTYFHAISGTRAGPAHWVRVENPKNGVFGHDNTRRRTVSTDQGYTAFAPNPVATETSFYTGFQSWNAENAEKEWESVPSSDVDAQGVAIVDSTVFTTTKQGVVYAFDADTGEQQWKTETDVTATGSAAVRNGRVHLNGIALDAETGQEQWRKSQPDQFVTTPAVTTETVFTATQDGGIFALDAETGDTKWETELTGPITAAPVIAANHIYVVTDDTLYAFSP